MIIDQSLVSGKYPERGLDNFFRCFYDCGFGSGFGKPKCLFLMRIRPSKFYLQTLDIRWMQGVISPVNVLNPLPIWSYTKLTLLITVWHLVYEGCRGRYCCRWHQENGLIMVFKIPLPPATSIATRNFHPNFNLQRSCIDQWSNQLIPQKIRGASTEEIDDPTCVPGGRPAASSGSGGESNGYLYLRSETSKGSFTHQAVLLSTWLPFK